MGDVIQIQTTWRKSTFTQGADNCVEVYGSFDRVRDSKFRGPEIRMPKVVFDAFVSAVKDGRLGA